MRKSVLIVGGSYFIGKKIVDVMTYYDYDVFTLNRGTNSNPDRKVKQLICDRENLSMLKEVLKDYLFDFVIDVSALNEKHVAFLHMALNHSRLKRYLFISSSAVYDIEHLSSPFKETDAVCENKYWTIYGANKIAAEEYLQKVYQGTHTNLVCIRPPYVYGENNYAQRESFIFDHILNEKPILLPNKGNTKLQFIYSQDLAMLLLPLLERTIPACSVFNVGNCNAITMLDWIYACEKVVQQRFPDKKAHIVPFDYEKTGYTVRDFFPFFDYDNVLDTASIKKYYPKETDFLNGLQVAFEWYEENAKHLIWKEQIIQNEKKILNDFQAHL